MAFAVERDFAHRGIDTARTRGATYADARFVRRQVEDAFVKNGHLDTIDRTDTFGFGVRVIAGGAWGFAASQVVSPNALVYDSQTAFRTGAANTGHALPPNPFASASPLHLRIEPGTRTREQLIREVERGVLVTRFHYTRWVHQLRTIVTGMTRDGTFLIEKGEIARPVKNFRFTQSYHDALAGTLGIGKDLHLFAAGEWGFGARRVPALRLRSFTFTGTTQY